MILEVQNIWKRFSEVDILKDVSFTVRSGQAMGFLGRNGAGKTTTIRTLMGVFPQDRGRFLVDGKPFDAKSYRVGYLPEERGMYPKEEILSQLVYFGMLRGGEKRTLERNATEWLERMELGAYRKKKLETLSKGNQQKVQIIQTLIDDPEILILDEPFSGLDPVNAQVLKDVILEMIGKDRLVIFSSHQMAYVEEFCDAIALIDKGEVILSGNLARIKRELGVNKLRVAADSLSLEELDSAVRKTPFVKHVRRDKNALVVELWDGDQQGDFLKMLVDQQVHFEEFGRYAPSLTEIFVAKVGENA